MHYLILAVLCSVAVSVLLKLARRHHIDIAQSIAVNYLMCIGLTWLILSPNFKTWTDYQPFWWLFGALGVLLPVVFLVMSRAVTQAGIVKSDAAQRLSLFIPIVWALIFFGEHLTHARALGIALAFLALLALLYKPKHKANTTGLREVALPLLGVWVGYGVIDVLFKQLSKLGKEAAYGNLFLMFVLAAVLIWVYLLIKQTKFNRNSLLAGVILGALNFGNILFYVRAHQAFKENPTLVFAGMNLGVIALGTLIGAGVFREKLSRINILGIILAMAAIFSLFYLSQLFPQWA